MNDECSDILYLFCVTDKIPEISEAKRILSTVYLLSVGGIYAVVGTMSSKDFGKDIIQENINRVEWLEKFAFLHEKVIESMMQYEINVIPFKFATLFYSEDNLSSLLLKQEYTLRENFKKLDKKEEWGLKLYLDMESFQNELLVENSTLLEMDAEIELSTPGKAYILKKKRQDLFKNIIQEEIILRKSECYKGLKKFTDESIILNNLSKDFTGRNFEMILNVVFLVEKKLIPTFLDKMIELKNSNLFNSFTFEHTGPWPPYNFIKMNEVVSE